MTKSNKEMTKLLRVRLPVVFRTHIKENNVSILNRLIVGSPGVSVVEDGAALPRATDAVVANVPTAAHRVAMIQERRLALILLVKREKKKV